MKDQVRPSYSFWGAKNIGIFLLKTSKQPMLIAILKILFGRKPFTLKLTAVLQFTPKMSLTIFS